MKKYSLIAAALFSIGAAALAQLSSTQDIGALQTADGGRIIVSTAAVGAKRTVLIYVSDRHGVKSIVTGLDVQQLAQLRATLEQASAALEAPAR